MSLIDNLLGLLPPSFDILSSLKESRQPEVPRPKLLTTYWDLGSPFLYLSLSNQLNFPSILDILVLRGGIFKSWTLDHFGF